MPYRLYVTFNHDFVMLPDCPIGTWFLLRPGAWFSIDYVADDGAVLSLTAGKQRAYKMLSAQWILIKE